MCTSVQFCVDKKYLEAFLKSLYHNEMLDKLNSINVL